MSIKRIGRNNSGQINKLTGAIGGDGSSVNLTLQGGLAQSPNIYYWINS